MKKIYILQDSIKGEIFKFGDKKLMHKAIDVFLQNGIDVNIKYIRDFDTMTQPIKSLVSTAKPRKSGVM